MRYMIDTCIVSFIVDGCKFSPVVDDILNDYNNQLFVSVETVKELIVMYRRKRMFNKKYKSERDLIRAISEVYGLQIIPTTEQVMLVYADLQLNEAEDHKDPSDHVIISHAIVERMPLISSDRKFHYYKNQGLDFIYNER